MAGLSEIIEVNFEIDKKKLKAMKKLLKKVLSAVEEYEESLNADDKGNTKLHK